MKDNTGFIAKAGLIAAFYTVLTMLSSLFGLSSGALQLRLSEMLCILAALSPAAIPGLTIGCFISNILSGCILWDTIFGTIATLLGALGTRLLRNKRYLAFLPPILSNTLIIPLILSYAYNIKQALWLLTLSVFISELISCGILGQITYKIMSTSIFKQES